MSGEHGCFCEEDRGSRSTAGPNEIYFRFPNFAEPNLVVQPGTGGTPIRGVQSADIDESNDTIFTVEDGKEALGPAQVLQVSHLGQPILTFGGGTIHHATGIAVNSNNHKVYVTSDTPTPHIDIFKRNPTPVIVPDANTLPAGSSERNHRHPARGNRSGRRRHHHRLPLRLGSENQVRIRHAALQGGWERNQHHLQSDGSHERCLQPDPGQPVPLPGGHPERQRPLVLRRRPAVRGLDAADLHARCWSKRSTRTPGTSTLPSIHTAARPSGVSKSAQEDCSLGGCEVIESGEGTIKTRLTTTEVQASAPHLEPNTLYHVRLVAENGAGEDRTVAGIQDLPGAADRRHMWEPGGAPADLGVPPPRLPRLRARHAPRMPAATTSSPTWCRCRRRSRPTRTPHDRVLYGLHYGSIPNIAGEPAELRSRPLRRRKDLGWLGDALRRHSRLKAWPTMKPTAHPCLAPTNSSTPLPSAGKGSVIRASKAMEPTFRSGSTAVLPPSGMVGAYSGPSEPEGTVFKSMSADGSHLVFGSAHAFATGGEEGELNIYSRNLSLGTTELVSTDESGDALSDTGLAEPRPLQRRLPRAGG